MNSNNELLKEFVQEAEAHIVVVEAGLLAMEDECCDAETVHRIFRAVHSIKGTAGFFELSKIVELSHSMENLFGALRDQKIDTSPEMMDVLLKATDLLKQLVDNLGDDDYDIAEQVAGVKAFLPHEEKKVLVAESSAWDMWDQLTATEVATNDQRDITMTLTVRPESKMDFNTAAALDMWDELETMAPPDKMELPLVPILPPNATLDTNNKKKNERKKGVTSGDSVRVSVELLNDLLNMVGEMVLKRNQLLRISQNAGRDVPSLDVVAQDIDALTTSLQEKVMKTRMQPISNVFNKFPRIVRELSRKMQKEVELVMEGMNVELDRSMIESLLDPITHLIRNALDHGIEMPSIRITKNKEATGTVRMYAYHESGRVILDISDDGAGIDIEKIIAKVVAKDWASKKELSLMREQEILNFIMRPGFSTAEQVTDISGRGVGMDVVKTNIEKLGGKVEIHTEVGHGTIFRLILPLTLAIISSFIVEAEDLVFAFPQASVKELVLIEPEKRRDKRIEFVNSIPLLRLRNELLPIFCLSDVLGLSENSSDKHTVSGESFFADTERTFRIMVIKSGSLRYGLSVDAIYDTEEILVKPVPATLKTRGYYSGVTILGDGRIAMIIDPEMLRCEADLCTLKEGNITMQTRVEPVIDKKNSGEEQHLLLFKCSGDEMLGIDLAMVSRIEEVDVSHIQKFGAKQYLAFRGQTIRIIRPENYLPISKKKHSKASKVYVIMPKLVKHPIGIVAEKIHDVILMAIQLDDSGICGKKIIGSTLVGDTIVTLLNIYELFEEAAPEYYAKPVTGKKQAVQMSTAGMVNESKRAIVLLVEDTPFFLKLTKSYLESDGYEVLTAENGREALDLLLTMKVDVVVSDIEMPIMTGIELVRAIRANDQLKHLPVIAVTSLTSDEDVQKGKRAGFDIYEFKLDRGRLLESIKKVLGNAK